MSKVWNMIRKLLQWRPSIDIWEIRIWVLASIISLLVRKLILKKDGSVNRRVLKMASKLIPEKRKPIDGVYTVDITIDSSTGTWCRLFVPSWSTDAGNKKNDKLAVMIFFHGGGFFFGHPDAYEYDNLCRYMSSTCRAVVISGSYRQSPEHKCPIPYDDGLKTFEWVRSQTIAPHQDFPIDAVDFSRVFLAGDSAGANIAHHITVKAGTMDISPIVIAGLVHIQPFFGGVERTASEIRFARGQMLELATTDWIWRAFLPSGSDRDHPSCNVCGPNSPPFRSLQLPKTLVVVGGRDLLMDRQIEYVEAMRSAGKDCKLVLFENSIHGLYYFGTKGKVAVQFHDEIAKFVNYGAGGATDDDAKSATVVASST